MYSNSFSLKEYGTVYIEENKSVSTTILTLKATDLDKEENARISYLLKGE